MTSKIEWKQSGVISISTCGLYACSPKIWPEIVEGDFLIPNWWYNGKSRSIGELMDSNSAKEFCQEHKKWIELKANRGYK